MSKLFDTLEQIRSNESSSLHPAPETAQTKRPKTRKKILAVVLILCGVATASLYLGDVSLFNNHGFFSRSKPAEKRSLPNTSLPIITQQKPDIINSKNSKKSLTAVNDKQTERFTSHSIQDWQDTLQKSSLSRSKRAVTLNNIGSYYISRKQHWKGLAYLDKALAIEPENPVFLINFGVALSELGMVEFSTKYFQKAQKINPDHPALIKNTALLKKTNLMPMAFNKSFHR